MNKAIKLFLGETTEKLDLRKYDNWYDTEILSYLTYLNHKIANIDILPYVFQGFNDQEGFYKQIGMLGALSMQLQKCICFIGMESPIKRNHFIVGILIGNKLLMINPLGLSKDKDHSRIVEHIKEVGGITSIYNSSLRIQNDAKAIVSCGPICAEIMLHITSLPFKKILILLDKLENEAATIEEIVLKLLPDSLLKLKDLAHNTEKYQAEIENIRNTHYSNLLTWQKNCELDIEQQDNLLDSLLEPIIDFIYELPSTKLDNKVYIKYSIPKKAQEHVFYKEHANKAILFDSIKKHSDIKSIEALLTTQPILINCLNINGYTLLMAAIMEKYHDAINLLIDKGISFDAGATFYKTALEFAESYEDHQTISILKSANNKIQHNISTKLNSTHEKYDAPSKPKICTDHTFKNNIQQPLAPTENITSASNQANQSINSNIQTSNKNPFLTLQEKHKGTKRNYEQELNTKTKKSKSYFSSSFTKKANFVIGIPVVVKADPNASSSEDSSSDSEDDYQFQPSDFEKPYPYSINKNVRAKIDEDFLYSDDESDDNTSSKHAKSTTAKLIKIFENESFGRASSESKYEAKQYLALSLGLNKVKSIAKRRNKVLQCSLNEPIKTNLPLKRFGFYLLQQYQKKGAKVTYNEVRSFYKQLKKRNKKRAKDFLNILEGKIDQSPNSSAQKNNKVKSTNSNWIPFRELRQTITQHSFTKKLIKNFREINSHADVYMGIMDDDIISLRANDLGTFSFYNSMIHEHNNEYGAPLEIASTGYKIIESDNPLLELAVEIDLWVRHETTSIIKQGAYYPEPNTIIRIPANQNKLNEKFIVKHGENYKSPNENYILIRDIIKTRKINPQATMAFNAKGAMVTTTPPRMKDTTFAAYINNNNKLVRWRLPDFKSFRGISQTHYSARDWAICILEAFTLPDEAVIKDNDKIVTLTDKGVIRRMLISAISRLFNCYDPINIAEKMASDKSKYENFPKALVHLLQDNNYAIYVEHLSEVAAADTRDDSKKTPKIKSVWNLIDNTTQLSSLKGLINQLLNPADAISLNVEAIQQAAQKALSNVAMILKDRLETNFVELSYALAKSYFNHLKYFHNNILQKSLESTKGTIVDICDKKLTYDVQHKNILTKIIDIIGNKDYIKLFRINIKSTISAFAIKTHRMALDSYLEIVKNNPNIMARDNLEEEKQLFLKCCQDIFIKQYNIYIEDELNKLSALEVISEADFIKTIDLGLYGDIRALHDKYLTKQLVSEHIKQALNCRLEKFEIGSQLHIAALENNWINRKSELNNLIKNLPTPEQAGLFGMYPLHWAAITGNKEMIEWLISMQKYKTRAWIADIAKVANFNVTALHCALKYCVDNGNDLELIGLLCNEQTVKIKTADELSPLAIAITELEDPSPVIHLLCEYDVIPENLQRELFYLVEKATTEELRTPILAAITYLNNPQELITEFIAHGFDIDQPGILETNDGQIETYPILKAIADKSIKFVRFLLQFEPEITEIKDEQGRPTLFVAYEEASINMMELLVAAGANIDECNDEETTLIHEAIAPLDDSGYDENLLKFLLRHGVNMDATDGANQKPLKVALENGNAEAIKLLVAADLDTDELPKSETKAIRELTGIKIYNEEETLEKDKKKFRKEVKIMTRLLFGYIPPAQNEEEKNDNHILQSAFDYDLTLSPIDDSSDEASSEQESNTENSSAISASDSESMELDTDTTDEYSSTPDDSEPDLPAPQSALTFRP